MVYHRTQRSGLKETRAHFWRVPLLLCRTTMVPITAQQPAVSNVTAQQEVEIK